ncbi:MAG TPA: glycosyltransferase 87 family protein [Thermoleophilaceae bacterium]
MSGADPRGEAPAATGSPRSADGAPGTALSLRGRRLLWAIVGAGTLVRLAIAFATDTSFIDLESFAIVRDALDRAPLDLYSNVEGTRWPYPPGYLPVVAGLDALASATTIDFLHLVRVVPSLADAGLAVIVQHLLGRRGASERARLAAAGAVALGPVFVGVAAYQGQIDSVAILPALAAFAVWERGGPRRALAAGLLIGAGGAVKTVPLLMLVALAPSARSRREATGLAAAALAVPLAALAPFLAGGAGDVLDHFRYRGFPGLGGLSLVVQPDLPLYWLAGHDYDPNAATRALLDAGGAIVAVALAATAAAVARLRPHPVDAAILLWLAVWLLGLNFFLQYLVWGLPFLLARGHLRRAVAIQLLAAPALLVIYLDASREWLVWALYTVPLIALWGLTAAAFASGARGAAATAGYAPAMPGRGPSR